MTERPSEIYGKTKILCTLGPATSSAEKIRELMKAGAVGVRLNFSHGSGESFKSLFGEIDRACKEENKPLSILIDLQGPKIRIGELAEPEIEIFRGDEIEISTDAAPGTKKNISTSYKPLVRDSGIGDTVLIDDGLIRLKITGKKKNSVVCLIENGGVLKPRKGMNLPGMNLSTKSVTEKDYSNLELALGYRVDYVALSFVRSAGDITELRDWMEKRNCVRPIIAKIEKREAWENFDSILDAADGIMVARGDLGVEMPPQEVPVIQKEIIRKCNRKGKLVITATQMLESMINNPVPTRAEASDVANAVLDGTGVVMLSGETAVGKYPVKTVQIMNDIIKNTDPYFIPLKSEEFEIPQATGENLFDSVGCGIVSMSRQINAAAIVVFIFQGRTAINISKYRPCAEIIAVSNNFETMNKLCLRWGVTSIFCPEIDKEHFAVDNIKKMILNEGLVREGDIVIFAAGAPYSEKSRANWLRFEVI